MIAITDIEVLPIIKEPRNNGILQQDNRPNGYTYRRI